MAIVASLCGIALIALVLWEAFETIVLPRRVTRRFRLTRLFYRRTWLPWALMIKSFVPARRRETWLSYFGPVSLLFLLSIRTECPGPGQLLPDQRSPMDRRERSGG